MVNANCKGSLLIRIERAEDTIQITFADDGPGITPENLEKIFDPFYTTIEVGQGTGLGLSICHGIIMDHGGRICTESESGKGASFITNLPIIIRGEQFELAESEEKEAYQVSSAKILVADDELIVRDYLSEVLREKGIRLR